MQRPHTSKIDMWALGIILYKLASSGGAHPFESTNYHEMIKSITDKEPNPLPSTASPFIKRLIAALLDKNPQARPDADELIRMEEIQVYTKKIVSQVSVFDQLMGK
jgi:serine/threonine protein kinase